MPGSYALAYVQQGCSASQADGSAEHPWGSIGQALDFVEPETQILVAPGVYEESVWISANGILLVGSTSPDDLAQATVIRSPPGSPAIVVKDAEEVVIADLHILEPTSAGIWVWQGKVQIEGCSIENALPDEQDEHGYGILATNGSDIEVVESTILHSPAAGILIQSSLATIRDNMVGNNAGGGLRLELSGGDPGDEQHAAIIEGNTFKDNMVVGVGVFGSEAALRDNLVTGTAAGGVGDVADGIIVSELKDQAGEILKGSSATIEEGNTIDNSGRIGVIFAAGSAGEVVDGNVVSGNGSAGIWVQDGAGTQSADGIRIEGNHVLENTFVGICVTTGARTLIKDNVVEQTLKGEKFEGAKLVATGDGIALLNKAEASVVSNQLNDNWRVGIVADSAAGSGTNIADNQIVHSVDSQGIVLQNQSEDDPVEVAPDANPGSIPETAGPDEKPLELLAEMKDGFVSPASLVSDSDPGGLPETVQ